MEHSSPGLLLVNLGTPDAPTPKAVRRFLAEFLGDPDVLDISPLARFLLLHLIILPFRSHRSARAYGKVWSPEGSPLLVFSRHLQEEVATRLEPVPLELAMRYGQPDLESAIRALAAAGCERLVVLPLFPQFAQSTIGSILAAVRQAAGDVFPPAQIEIIPPFFLDNGFLAAWAEVALPALKAAAADHVLISFHGLPLRHLRKADASGVHCLTVPDCCDALSDVNRNCYRAQCMATARALARVLHLAPEQHSISFQSRLGGDAWTKPSTVSELKRLARGGVRKVAVLCPAFVADCLETLEEIRIRGRETFRRAGGEELVLIPSLNAHPAWADAVAALFRHPRAAPHGP